MADEPCTVVKPATTWAILPTRLTLANRMLATATIFVAVLGATTTGLRHWLAGWDGTGVPLREMVMGGAATVMFCLLPWGLAAMARGRGLHRVERYNQVFALCAWILLLVFTVDLVGSGLLSLRDPAKASAHGHPFTQFFVQEPAHATEVVRSQAGPATTFEVAVLAFPVLPAAVNTGPAFEAEQRMIGAMRRTAAKVEQPERARLEVTADWIQGLLERRTTVLQARASLGERTITDPWWISARRDIELAKNSARSIYDANEEVIHWLQNASEIMRGGYQQHAQSGPVTERAIIHFLQDLRVDQHLSLAFADRDCAIATGRMAQLLDLTWGEWRYDESRSIMIFESASVAEAWTALQRDVKEAAAYQAAVHAAALASANASDGSSGNQPVLVPVWKARTSAHNSDQPPF